MKKLVVFFLGLSLLVLAGCPGPTITEEEAVEQFCELAAELDAGEIDWEEFQQQEADIEARMERSDISVETVSDGREAECPEFYEIIAREAAMHEFEAQMEDFELELEEALEEEFDDLDELEDEF